MSRDKGKPYQTSPRAKSRGLFKHSSEAAPLKKITHTNPHLGRSTQDSMSQ